MTFQSQFFLLFLERFIEFLLLAVAFLALELLGRYRLAGTRLRVGVVRWSPGTFLGVFLLPPLGAPVLEPNLNTMFLG